jgi:hypothetical protein
MAPQNFNPWSLTFDRVLFDVSQVGITANNYDCRVSDRGLKFCGATSGQAIFLISILFLLHQDYKTSPSSIHFWVFVKISLLFVNYFVSTRTPVRSNKLFFHFFLSVLNKPANVIDYVSV